MAVVEANEMQRLQSEIDALQEQLAELQRQKLQLEEQQQQHLESAGTDWKLIHEATKWSGMSVAECGTGFCTFHFHPSSGRDSESTYAMTVKFLENDGYSVHQSFLPESIRPEDLEAGDRPLQQLVANISDLVDCYVNRGRQLSQLEEFLGENADRSVAYTADYQHAVVRIKVADGSTSEGGFMINIGLRYRPAEILPHHVDFEVEGRALSEEEATDFEGQSHPFYVSPLLQAFKSAFD